MKLHEIKRLDLLEAFGTRPDIKWRPALNTELQIDHGHFNIDQESYRINIEHNSLNVVSRKLNAIHVSFSRMVDGDPIVAQTDSKYPSRVFGGVVNGILDKIKEINPDIVLFTAKFDTDKDKHGKPNLEVFNQRVKLYNSLRIHVSRISGYNELTEPLISKTGHHFILVNPNSKPTKEELQYIKSSSN